MGQGFTALDQLALRRRRLAINRQPLCTCRANTAVRHWAVGAPVPIVQPSSVGSGPGDTGLRHLQFRWYHLCQVQRNACVCMRVARRTHPTIPNCLPMPKTGKSVLHMISILAIHIRARLASGKALIEAGSQSGGGISTEGFHWESPPWDKGGVEVGGAQVLAGRPPPAGHAPHRSWPRCGPLQCIQSAARPHCAHCRPRSGPVHDPCCDQEPSTPAPFRAQSPG